MYTQQHFIVFRLLKLMMISFLVIAGCIPTNPVQPTSQATETQYLAALTAVESSVKVLKGETSETEVPQDVNVNVWVDDRIEVGGGSRAILKFPDFLDVELYRNAQLLLADAKLESGEAISVVFNHIQGHVGVSLYDRAHTRVTLETPDAVIKTLENGTEFIVCVAPGKITCVDVLKGSIEVTAQGKKENVRAGEASYIKTGQPPVPAICAPGIIFQEWKENMRASADTPSVSMVVADLPQRPCISKEMVEISAGTYEIGSDLENEFHSGVRSIQLAYFRIDTYEVTNIQYQYYLDQTGSQPPAVWPGEWAHPVRGVTWDQAAAYCSWANKRLPSEAEWEVAGRGSGPDAPLYPWGNDSQAGGEIVKLPLDDTYSVGAFPFNISPSGAYDMAGNVWEWVGEPYDSVQAGYQILRGGRFGFIKDLAYREQARPDDERYVLYAGFRCATSQSEEE